MELAHRKLGSGKPLFILHGLFGSSDNWQTIGKHFAESFTVYLIDERNHGHSPHSEEFNYEVMSEDVNELMQDEGLESVMLLGHSMGGKLSMQFAINYPAKVEKMVVVDIGPKQYSNTNQNVIDAIEKFDPQTLASRKEAEKILALYISEESVKQFLLKNLYWDDSQKLQWRFDFENIKKNIERVGDITPLPSNPVAIPVLFLKGEKSDYIAPSDMNLMKKIFPLSRLEVIANAGHWVHADQPQEFFDEVIKFLKGEE